MKLVFKISLIVFAIVLPIVSAGPAAATDFPGPDDFGYNGVTIEPNLRDISSTGTSVILSDDQVSVPLPIGFTFNYYGIDYTTFRISSNGFITLGGGPQPTGCCTGQPIPTTSSPNNLIAGWWEDLNNPLGNFLYETVGSPDSQELIVGFYAVPHFSNGPRVTFEIVLHEGSNAIEIQCWNCPSDGGLHSVGIENADGTIGLQVLRTSESQIGSAAWLLSANLPPQAVCQDVTVSVDEFCAVEADVDNGSFDPEDDYFIMVQDPPGPYQLGDNEVTLTVTDDSGRSSSCTATVTVVDDTPPTVTAEVAIDSLWPPLGKMIDVGLTYEVLDSCDEDPVVVIEVTSDEPTAGSHHFDGSWLTPDAAFDDDGGLFLRAQRYRRGDGRLYEITVTATDESGNSGSQSTSVQVNRRKWRDAIDSGQSYDATRIN